MGKKLKSYLILGILAIGLLLSAVSIQVEAETPPLQAGDMSIIAAVTTTNISIYSLDSLNITAKIQTSNLAMDPINAMFHVDSVRLVTGTNSNALYQYFINSMFKQFLASFQTSPDGILTSFTPTSGIATSNNPVTIYSLSPTGLRHLGPNPTLTSLVMQHPALKSFTPSVLRFGTLDMTPVNNVHYTSDINTFASMLGVNQSDFNAIGKEAQNQETFKTGDVLGAGSRSYDPLNTVNSSTAFDDTYEQYAMSLGLLNITGNPINSSLSTENLVGGTTSNSKYDVLYAGYTNFEQEAIKNPFINYFVALEAANGTTVDPNSFYVDYSRVNNTDISQFESDILKTTIMGPIGLGSSTSSSSFGLVQKKVSLNFFGMPVFTTLQKLSTFDLINFGTTKPLLSLNSFTALSKATTTSIMSSVGSTMPYINKVKDMTSTGLYGAMHQNTGLTLGSARTGSLITSQMTKETTDPANPNHATSNSVSQSSSIPHSIINFLKSYAPFILLGVGAIAVLVLVILTKKKRAI